MKPFCLFLVSGELPDGMYKTDTTVEYCCNTAGIKLEGIILPRETSRSIYFHTVLKDVNRLLVRSLAWKIFSGTWKMLVMKWQTIQHSKEILLLEK